MQLLDDVLKSLKAAKVLRASVKTGDLELQVEFPPDFEELTDALPGVAPLPGGWKAPQLDDPFEEFRK